MFEEIGFASLALLSAVLAAIANLLARTILKRIKGKDIYSTNFFIITAVLLLTSPWFFKFEPTYSTTLLFISICALDALANYFYFKTFEKTEASLASPLFGLAPAFAFLFALVLISETVEIIKLAMSIAIIFLIIFFSMQGIKFKRFKAQTLKPALFASLLFGLSAIPSKVLLNSGTINEPTLYLFRAAFLGMTGLLIFRNTFVKLSIREYWFVTIRSFFVVGQWLLLYAALSRGGAGISLTLANTTPVFVFLLGIFFLKEKKTWQKFSTAILAIVLSLALLV